MGDQFCHGSQGRCLYGTPHAYALLHVSAAAKEEGAVAAKAEHLKSAKYAALKVGHRFVPFAVEMSSVLGQISDLCYLSATSMLIATHNKI